MARVLVHHWKHGEFYYDASTPANTLRAYYEMLKFNDEAGCYYKPEPSLYFLSNEDKKMLALESEDVAELPDFLKKKHAKLTAKVNEANRAVSRELVQWERIQRIISMPREEAIFDTTEQRYERTNGEVYVKNPSTLALILGSRGDYEYERYEIEDIETYDK